MHNTAHFMEMNTRAATGCMTYHCSLLKEQVGVIAFWHDLLPLQEMGMRRLHSHQLII